ncbi:phage Mu protein F like protein [Orbus hercynius]|uniref:Phage Mu protein F like protein n=1 Tax=Orbus hercynius TaxID=593135 RepID=A0A495RIG4_9GAMM|nr:phage minor head protein [Orbus hercynius]RKS87322.1 phage Mu protein F like protein [Orbus hercynius]
MKKNLKTLKINSIRPSSIIEANYHKKLAKLVKITQTDINALIKDYTEAKSNPYYVNLIADRFRESIDKWGDRFLHEANEIATGFTDESLNMVDRRLSRDFKNADLTIKFQMTEKMQAKIQSKIAENVGLIRSIPSKYLEEVQGAVMRCIERGNDLKTLTEILEYRFGVASRRAKNIAKDQANKATVAFNRQRQLDVGIKKGIWVHSGLGKDKRQSHVKAGRDKLVFDLEKGAYIDGEYILPGELVNCHCTWRAYLGDF